jgi:hypothetical protein
MENNKIRIIGGSNEKGTGVQGTVIQINDDYCFKILSQPFNSIDFYIKMKALSSNLKRIIAPIYLQINDYGQIHGYSMKKVNVIDWSNLLDTRICDLTAQYKEFLDDAKLLSTNLIKIVDMDMKNLLLSPSGIVAIDTDAYQHSSLSSPRYKQDLLKENIHSVTMAISMAIRDSIMFYSSEFESIRAAQIQPIVDTVISDNNIEQTLREYARQLIVEPEENKKRI